MESDWPKKNKSHYITQIVSWLRVADVIFGGDKQQPEIRLRSQATCSCAKRNLEIKRYMQNNFGIRRIKGSCWDSTYLL